MHWTPGGKRVRGETQGDLEKIGGAGDETLSGGVGASNSSFNSSGDTYVFMPCTTSDKKDTRKSTRQTEPGFIQSWQRGKSITECLKYSLQKEVHTDVIFKVGQSQKNMQAHKLILSLRSCVFEAMLKGPLAEQDNIVIPDVEPAIFEEFLQYLYTDEVTLTGDNVIGLLYVSKKYDVSTLEQLCLTFLSSSMTSDDACFVMEQAHLYDEIQLMEKSLNCILENGDAALKSAGLISLCHECLVKIANRTYFRQMRNRIFEAAMIWSESACRKQNKDLSP
ncbi:BTB/POZ domain-containing protein 3-like [Gigantopelta aegis]|uniref:BTB/POZ domain-containing protein 3-like n=1 Tax=Gigantopelta aegis TaxID=1735272 RepID=UPI001B889D3C|nr:BTB/POZ domain-containing protein 3-like [Gigantopelta aegis]